MKNPYEILGLNENSTKEEQYEAYNRLKEEYSEGRFKSGVEGNEAARKLNELEEAWRVLTSQEEIKEVNAQEGYDFAYVDKLIREGNYDEAQKILDSMSVREGEWHYFQSIIYYKRDWLTESRKQLEEAVKCDPYNNKYKLALDKLNIVMGNRDVNPQNLGRDQSQYQENMTDMRGGDCLSNCCTCYCLYSLCCDSMRCCM